MQLPLIKIFNYSPNKISPFDVTKKRIIRQVTMTFDYHIHFIRMVRESKDSEMMRTVQDELKKLITQSQALQNCEFTIRRYESHEY
jgi:hypothetical protein